MKQFNNVVPHPSIAVEAQRDFLYLEEAAAWLRARGHRISAKTLKNKCALGEGPRREYKGRNVIFKEADLLAWDKANTERRDAFHK